MIEFVGMEKLSEAAAVHSASWKASHEAFCSEAFVAQHTPARQAAYLEKELQQGKRLFLYREGEKAVGIVSVWNDLIENLYVLPEEQRKGYGQRLLRFIMTQCENEPALWVLNNNTGALSLYRSEGFIETGETHPLAKGLKEIRCTAADAKSRMRIRGLALYGAKCDLTVWDGVYEALSELGVEYAAYPEEILRGAEDVSALADWLGQAYGGRAYDFILGHSMGGQIALSALASGALQAKKLLLLESNLTPCGSFYRNLMAEENAGKLAARVEHMFRREEAHYGKALLAGLREDFDFTEKACAFPGEIYALYGDRGQPQYPGRLAELNLSPMARQKLHTVFLKDCCHLPMLEQPEALCAVLRDIVCGRREAGRKEETAR